MKNIEGNRHSHIIIYYIYLNNKPTSLTEVQGQDKRAWIEVTTLYTSKWFLVSHIFGNIRLLDFKNFENQKNHGIWPKVGSQHLSDNLNQYIPNKCWMSLFSLFFFF